MSEKRDGKAARAENALSPRDRRLGFMIGEGLIPDDFDRMGAVEIERLFAGDACDCQGRYEAVDVGTAN
jgi:hypothetical protein